MVVVVCFRVLDFLQRDDDLVIELLSVLRLAERQVDVVGLVLAVSVLDLQACETFEVRYFKPLTMTNSVAVMSTSSCRYLLQKNWD